MDKNPEDQKIKPGVEDDDQSKKTKAAMAEASTIGWGRRWKTHIGQKTGFVEQTKLEPRFERNIEKLISYHNIIYKMVDAIELQVQIDPKILAQRRVSAPNGENEWGKLGGWLHYLAMSQFTEQPAKILDSYSRMCGKIGQKENQVQRRTRSHLIKRMRLYTGDDTEELNKCVDALQPLLTALDDTRRIMKSAKVSKDLVARGQAYQSMILAFNHKAGEIQGWIDEVTTVVTLHQNELIRFCREVAVYNDAVYNNLNETMLRLGYLPHKKDQK
ncbi:hypothetical protein GCK72_009372 [Caenorhabditis remanei]|uniref:BAR domain-containing protein n=1 Tax=Caenorhabditis remanei TaxID=31234 RepID=A0A6A5H080_CAERE|nr:hypothetical protein GCK72_009372 [Caenorhabditis remanei]KAF1761118.1 hypothetical protein GCK72_009372 [Caenorhabditis remanei]